MTTGLRERLQATLGSAYSIERELGGGMSRVFVAEDTALGRRIVIKVLPPELAAEINAERFRREIYLAARLQHPHIVPLLAAGETGGVLYYTMPFVEGESLRERLRREGELPVAEAARILCEVLDALDYAHRHGVAHRDIKPENILLAEHHALVTDFGVAKALSAATGGAGQGSHTSAGVAVGTPTYMAPEQVAADPGADHRVDIYAIGTVAYEMLTGQPPFRGSSPRVLAAHIAERPTPLRMHRPAVPESIAAVLMRCLEKDPADRPQSSAELVRALDTTSRPAAENRGDSAPIRAPGTRPALSRRLWLAAAAVLALMVGASAATNWGYVTRARGRAAGGSATGAAAVPQPVKSVAVLPFVNVGADPREEYFSDGMTDELTSALGKVRGLRVAARSSAFTFKGKNADAREVAERLHVAAILEGSVRRAGARLRVTAQLVNASDGMALWGETYERDQEDVFAIQDDITQAIVSALAVRLQGDPQTSVAGRPPPRLDAYNLYLQGRYFWNRRNDEGLRKAVAFFARAVRADTAFALAYAGLADAYGMLNFYGLLSPAEAHAKARAAIERAIRLDSSLAEAHNALANDLESFDWDWSGAEREYRRAIILNPSYATAHHWYAFHLMERGRLDEALREIRRAEELDPLSPIIKVSFAQILRAARRPDEAILRCREALELDPSHEPAHFILSSAYRDQRQFDRAIDEIRPVMATSHGRGGPGDLGADYALAGRRGDALRVLAALTARARREYVPPGDMAHVYIGLGEPDSAFAWLERSLDNRSIDLTMKVDPFYDPLRADPRFTRLLRAVGLE